MTPTMKFLGNNLINGIILFSFYRTIQFNDSKFETVALAGIVILTILMLIALGAPLSEIRKQSKDHTDFHKIFYFLVSLGYTVLLFYTNHIVFGGFYVLSWFFYEVKERKARNL